MNNQGLEALAALATAGQTDPSSGRGAGDAKRSGENGGGSRSSGTVASNASGDGFSSRDSNGLATHSSQHGDRSSNASQMAQWQQIMSNLAASGVNANSVSSNPNLAFLSGMQQSSQSDNSSLMMAMQNMAHYQLMAQAQAANQNQLSALSNLAMQLSRTNPQGTGLGHSQQNPLASFLKDTSHTQSSSGIQHQIEAASKGNFSQGNSIATNNSKATVSTVSKTSVNAPTRRANAAPIAPQPSHMALDSYHVDSDGGMSDEPVENKREQKRAANRRSAQLSRKRKKQYIEELKEENDDLRRKEQILKSLPDLVVVFDSSGKLGFVSHSVDRLLNFTSTELEGTSFWDRLCEESVRLLKAAFMDSLATRETGFDTAPLGTGVWELRLVDKNKSQKLVALNGVVHFAGDKPECVCTIRPREKDRSKSSNDKNSKSGHPAVSIDSCHEIERPSAAKKAKIGKSRDLVRISDSGNSTPESGDSESGSSDE